MLLNLCSWDLCLKKIMITWWGAYWLNAFFDQTYLIDHEGGGLFISYQVLGPSACLRLRPLVNIWAQYDIKNGEFLDYLPISGNFIKCVIHRISILRENGRTFGSRNEILPKYLAPKLEFQKLKYLRIHCFLKKLKLHEIWKKKTL